MWKKDGILWNGKSVIVGDRRIFNPTPEQLKAAGYVWEEPVPVEPIEIPKRYSTLKIIRALGDEWETYRAQLQTAGVLDQFFAANYLSADDPVFMAFVANVPEKLKAQLDECLWEDN
jgi:hypothetical protein